MSDWLSILTGDCREVLPTLEAGSVHCVVTSPPYWGLRDYGVDGQLGLEPTPDEYVANMVAVFREVRRVLRDDGTVWLNLGDSYAGAGRGQGGAGIHSTKQTTTRGAYFDGHSLDRRAITDAGLAPKQLVGIPWRVAFALQADGWYLRSDIIWSKPNPMPESVTDRPTKSHEYVFLLSKSARYYFDQEAVREPLLSTPEEYARDGASVRENHQYGAVTGRPLGSKSFANVPAGRNIRSVWTIATQPYPGAHFATFPPALVEPCIKAGCPEGGTVLDPFGGSGTVGMVANRLSRRAILIELNPEYVEQIEARNRQAPLGLVG